MKIDQDRTDILILGGGGAGLMAALHATDANPDLDVTVAAKGLLGKSGCTRMVQGGYNAAIAAGDSVPRHFMDTIEGGKWINNQDLAWRLVNQAVPRLIELENRWGCFFDRNPDGTVHQKAFAGQTFDRTVHKGDLTGIEIMNRLSEQVWARPVKRLEEHRAIALVPSADGDCLAGALLLDVRTGSIRLVQAKAVLLATGGGPTMYRYHTPSGDKSCDGYAMALRLGLALRDMEMVQFHPTGLLAGPHTRMTGTVLEEGLRGAGGHLLDGKGERFMARYDAKGERATRDIVSRAMAREMRDGTTTPHGGLFISMGHLGADHVTKTFKGMVERCADCGFDLAGGKVEVVPTAHYMMGGVEFAADTSTSVAGLFAAGEDTGGVHGANRLGGNGVANSTVFGGIAGGTMAAFVGRQSHHSSPDWTVIGEAIERAYAPFHHPSGDLGELREHLGNLMWDKVGILRNENSLEQARAELADLDRELHRTGIADAERAFNLTWQDWLNLESLILTSRAILEASIARRDSRGAHYREDYPETGDLARSTYTRITLEADAFGLSNEPVTFSHVRPGESLVDQEEAVAAAAE